VAVDGDLVYSKDKTFRFPTNEEVFTEIRKRQKR
jgi:hypothetical protein